MKEDFKKEEIMIAKEEELEEDRLEGISGEKTSTKDHIRFYLL